MEQKASVVFYYTSATASLAVRKAVQSTRFFLFNKAILYTEYDCHYDDGASPGHMIFSRVHWTMFPICFFGGKSDACITLDEIIPLISARGNWHGGVLFVLEFYIPLFMSIG